MATIKDQYPLADVVYGYDEERDAPIFQAFCASDCAEEISFSPNPDNPDFGRVVIWFTSGWARKRIDDERVEYEQFGYAWEDVLQDDFIDIVSSEHSIGAAANDVLIQPRFGDSAVVWREYR